VRRPAAFPDFGKHSFHKRGARRRAQIAGSPSTISNLYVSVVSVALTRAAHALLNARFVMKLPVVLLSLLFTSFLRGETQAVSLRATKQAAHPAKTASATNQNEKKNPAPTPAKPVPKPADNERERPSRRPRPEHWFL
jgi:hypothetical protein